MLFDYVVSRAQVVGTELRGVARAVLVQLAGALADDGGEEATTEPLYGTLGVVVRPKPPTAAGAAEVVAMKREDGATPIAARDLRLNAEVNPSPDGEVCLVGYGGAFVSLKENADQDGGAVVIYAPGGNKARASVISIDTTAGNDHVALMHSSGVSITLTQEGKAIIASPNGQAYIEVSNAGLVLNGNVQITGSLVVGNPAAAQPVGLGAGAPAVSEILKAAPTP